MLTHFDKAPAPKFTETDEGYLRGRAVVSRAGVFRYRNADGTERLELRHPSDVLTQDSLNSLKQIPLTLDHPPELVNADNVKDYAIGYTGDDVQVDGGNITVNFTVTNADAIAVIKSGKRELSLGYRLDLTPEAGSYDGAEYTHRQTNVTYNHLAVVAKARAGAEARIHLDGASVQIETDQKEQPMTVKVNLDGIAYDAAPEVANAYGRAVKRADAAEQARADAERSREDMQKEYDALKGKMDALKEEMDGMKAKNNDAEIAAAAKVRVDLLTRAGKLTNADGLADIASPREIMETALKARNDKLDLSDKSDDYVAARFDAAVEMLDAGKAKAKENADKMGARADAAEPAKDHRADAAADIRNMWKKGA